MKFLKKIIIFIIILLSSSIINTNIWYSENISGLNSELKYNFSEKKLWDTVNNFWKNIINQIIYIFWGILVIFIVYSGIQMVISKWINEDDLNKAKRNFLYSIIWILFILFHETIYNALVWSWWGKWSTSYFLISEKVNLIVKDLLIWIQILIAWISIFIIVYEWIMLIINSRKDEEAFKKTKERIKWLVIALLTIWFLQIWIEFLKSWNIEQPKNIFKNIANMTLFLAWPIAVFFLTFAWYYYIFSWGNEENIKKWKNIIINTSIWIIILLCSYIMLNDISLLNFN